MGLDIRIPLGLMFLVTGALMALYGLFTRGSAIYEKDRKSTRLNPVTA